MVQKCNSRHLGPFSLGFHCVGQFRCENCDAVLSGVEVYIDATEHADAAEPGKNELVEPAYAY
jgi:hypothetical protein